MQPASTKQAVNRNAAPDPTEHGMEEYSVFTVNQKRAIVAVGSLASFFSPLSSSIYLPALDTIAAALHISITKVDLTVTTYLVSMLKNKNKQKKKKKEEREKDLQLANGVRSCKASHLC